MKQSINLLPKKSPQEQKARVQRRRFITAVVVFYIALALALISPFLFLENLKSEEESLLSQISGKKQSISKQATLEQQYRNVFNKAVATELLLKTGELFPKHIDNVKGLLNSGVSVREITIGKNKIKVSAVAADIASIMLYMEGLENENKGLAIFKELTLSSVTISKTGGYEAKIEGIVQ